MSNGSPQHATVGPNFTLAFQKMASFVAIAKTRVTSDVLDELIQQCFVILPSEPLATQEQVVVVLKTLFGIQRNPREVGVALQRLIAAGVIAQTGSGHFSLAPSAEASLSARIEAAKALELHVRDIWLKQVQALAPNLEGDRLWTALRSYLAQAFRRHGIQAVELLTPSIEAAPESRVGLSAVLDGIISREFAPNEQVIGREAVSSFFLTVNSDRKRAEYIASLADGAFNYFSLAVAPEVSQKLRGKLNELTLFLDTNFLFGILKLHANPQVDVSTELLDAIQRFKLPFRLRYHAATVRELSNTLFFFRKELNRQQWPQNISRAIASSGALAGIEFRYHQKNSQVPVSVDDFLAPFQHWQVLLKDKGIDVYNPDSSESHLRARADLEADYKDYLAAVDREKPIDSIQHDMAVLETVRSLRTTARNTLEAGALLVTCDYQLFRFDSEQSRKSENHYSTVLPSLLWQILRPFVSDDEEFDRAFAETFALPEFSLTRGGAQRAAARMASILASYSDIPEETAVKMLVNDLLIAELQTKHTDVEFAKTVESALAAENAHLLEDRAALAEQLERERLGRETKQRELEAAAELIRSREQVLVEKEQVIREKEDAIRQLQAQAVDQKQVVKETAEKVVREHQEKVEAKQRAEELEQAAIRADQRATWNTKIASVVIGLLAVCLYELVICFVWPWTWLLNHPNGYGLEGAIGLMIFFGILGLAGC